MGPVDRGLAALGLNKYSYEVRMSARNGVQLRVNIDRAGVIAKIPGISRIVPNRTRQTYSQSETGVWTRVAADIGFSGKPKSKNGRLEGSIFGGLRFDQQGMAIVTSASGAVTSGPNQKNKQGAYTAGGYRIFDW